MTANEPRTANGKAGAGTTAISKHAARKKKRTFWLNFAAVAVTLLIVTCSLFWLYAFHFYNVSSNSMAPALLAAPAKHDRLLCWNLTYLYRSPVRWEVATFRTPSNSASIDVVPGLPTGGEEGLTVKRIAGLANEQLAIAGGDIWTRPRSGSSPYQRQIKPDSVQRGMWIEVYKEDCVDIDVDEFLRSWKKSGDGEVALRDALLSLTAGTSLDYLPVTRTGSRGSSAMTVLPGIPDRYILPQDVLFGCESCGTEFKLFVNSQKIRGRCPNCRYLNEETSVTFYTLRSGLPETGKYHAGDVPQGDAAHFRYNSYNFVADLRITAEIRLIDSASEFRAELRGEDRTASVALGNGAVLVNDRAVQAGRSAPKTGEWVRVEFYVVEGTVRLYLGEGRNEVFNRLAYAKEKPEPFFDGGESGLSLRALNGGVEIRNLAIDRDVHYFTGRRQGMSRYLAAMDMEGQIDIPPGHFFPLGDNATVSLDGRSWGPVDMSLLKGTALYIWNPEERAGWIPSP